MRTYGKWILAVLLALLMTGCGERQELPQQETTTPIETMPDSSAASAEIRQALGLLLERNYIAEDLLGGGRIPAASLVPTGILDGDGTWFARNAGGNESWPGYFNTDKMGFEENYAQAYATLSRYFQRDAAGNFLEVPTLTCLCREEEQQTALGEYLCSALGTVGISVELEILDETAYQETLTAGDYSFVIETKTAACNSPLAFLEDWITENWQGWDRNGTYDLDLTQWGLPVSVTAGTWAETYDVLIKEIRTCADSENRSAMMHLAEDFLLSAGVVTPLYFGTEVSLQHPDVTGVSWNPAGGWDFSRTSVGGGGRLLTVCLSAPVDSLDPAACSDVDGNTLISHLFSGLARWETDDQGKTALVPDCAQTLPAGAVQPDGTVVYTYRLKEGLIWSDGQALTAGDFAYAWNRAAAMAGETGQAEIWSRVQTVKALDDRTLRVTLTEPVSFWNELLAEPAFFPVREDVVSVPGWSANPAGWVSNGAYTLNQWDHNNLVVLRRNENSHHAQETTMEEIRFYLSDTPASMLSNFENGFFQVITDFPREQTGAIGEANSQCLQVEGAMESGFLRWNAGQSLLPGAS